MTGWLNLAAGFSRLIKPSILNDSASNFVTMSGRASPGAIHAAIAPNEKGAGLNAKRPCRLRITWIVRCPPVRFLPRRMT